MGLQDFQPAFIVNDETTTARTIRNSLRQRHPSPKHIAQTMANGYEVPLVKDLLGSVELSHLTGIFFVNAVLKSSCSFVYTPVFRASFLETPPSATKSQQNLELNESG